MPLSLGARRVCRAASSSANGFIGRLCTGTHPAIAIIPSVIARRWRAWADDPANADAYVAHFERDVRPGLEEIDGFLGATLERVEDDDGRTEIVVVSSWTSMDAIRGFAGDEADVAVVEPEAREILADHDSRVHHMEIHDGEAFQHLELIDVPAAAAAHEPWFNETLTTVNDAVVRLGVLEGDFHWHRHDDQDEFFLVVEGELWIDLRDGDRTVTLGPHQGFVVPRGAVHRTRAPRRTTVLMVEAAGVAPTGD
jgi:mannose-6-phosphate isomerase-like protein (cupin superfamily)